MRRPINWVVVLISLCVLYAGTTLPGRGLGGSDSASGDNPLHHASEFDALPADASAPPAVTLREFRATYTAEPAVLILRDGARSDSAETHDHESFTYIAGLDDYSADEPSMWTRAR
jgi:hypothetical protein